MLSREAEPVVVPGCQPALARGLQCYEAVPHPQRLDDVPLDVASERLARSSWSAPARDGTLWEACRASSHTGVPRPSLSRPGRPEAKLGRLGRSGGNLDNHPVVCVDGYDLADVLRSAVVARDAPPELGELVDL